MFSLKYSSAASSEDIKSIVEVSGKIKHIKPHIIDNTPNIV